MTKKSSAAALPPEVEAVIEKYSPAKAAQEVWAEHGQLVVDRIRLKGVQGPSSANRLLSAGCGLLVFAAENEIPMEPDVVFADETIERYIAAKSEGTEKSRTTLRSSLRRLRDADKPRLTPVIAYQRMRPPYSRDELVALWRMVSSQPTKERTRRLQSLYLLGLGAGCASTDLRHVCGSSVRKENGVVAVDIGGQRPRVVPVLAGAGDKLFELAQQAGDKVMVAGNGDPSQDQMVNRLLATAVGGEGLPKLVVSRLRHSWMVAMMSANLSLAQLAEISGVSTFRTFEDFLPYCEAEPASPAVVSSALEVSWL